MSFNYYWQVYWIVRVKKHCWYHAVWPLPKSLLFFHPLPLLNETLARFSPIFSGSSNGIGLAFLVKFPSVGGTPEAVLSLPGWLSMMPCSLFPAPRLDGGGGWYFPIDCALSTFLKFPPISRLFHPLKNGAKMGYFEEFMVQMFLTHPSQGRPKGVVRLALARNKST